MAFAARSPPSGRAEIRKHFFFEKKKQKTSYCRRESPEEGTSDNKSFLVLFFKKEHPS